MITKLGPEMQFAFQSRLLLCVDASISPLDTCTPKHLYMWSCGVSRESSHSESHNRVI